MGRGGFGGGRAFGRGFERHEEGEEHGRGRRGRFFDQGQLRLVILQLTAEKPRHGYEIIKAIEEKLAGLYSPSPGVVYPTLTLLEEMGYVVVDQVDGKKAYAVTDEGRAYLQANQAIVDAIFERMSQAHAANRGGPPAPILRAMEGLKMALRLKLSNTAVTPDEVQAIASELDALTRRIEQA